MQSVNPIEDGAGKKSPPPSPYPSVFPLVTSTNVGISGKNFLNFSFNPFASLVKNFKFVPSVSPKLLNLNKDHPLKKIGFSGQILINLRLWFILSRYWQKLWHHNLFSKNLYFTKAWGSHFYWNHQNCNHSNWNNL